MSINLKHLKTYGPWVIVFIMGVMLSRMCTSENELKRGIKRSSERIEALQQSDARKQARIDSLKSSSLLLEDSLETTRVDLAVERAQRRNIISKYESRLEEAYAYTPHQADSFLTSRYPDLPEDSVKVAVVSDLIEGDRDAELVEQMSREMSRLELQVGQLERLVSNKEAQIETLEGRVADLNGIIEEKDLQITSYKRHIRKLKWKNFWFGTGGLVIGAAGVGIAIIAQ